MPFSEWLFASLVADHVISENDYTADGLDADTLLAETSVTADELDDYWAAYASEERSNGCEPLNDIGSWN